MLAPIPDGYAQLRTGSLAPSFALSSSTGIRSRSEELGKRKFGLYGRFHDADGVNLRQQAASGDTSLSAERLFTTGLRVLFVVSGRNADAADARKRRLKPLV